VVKELGKKVIAQNKSARHDYFIEEVYECGLVLTGTEVKSLRAGRASLTDGYAMAKDGEIWVSGIHITRVVGQTICRVEIENYYFTEERLLKLPV